jgi:tryptophan-rich sensory protein
MFRNIITDTTIGEKATFILTLLTGLVCVYVSFHSHHHGVVLMMWSGFAVLLTFSIWSVHRPKGKGL